MKYKCLVCGQIFDVADGEAPQCPVCKAIGDKVVPYKEEEMTWAAEHVIGIAKDVNAENQFKNFLRKEYISLQALYSNTDPVFILTDEIYRNNQEEKNKVYYLLNRARTF